MDNSRKASDVLLDLESKINQLVSMVHAQDLNLKVLSNKLNVLMKQTQEMALHPAQQVTNPYSISAEEVKGQDIKISNEKLPITENPQGFRRISRPETVERPRQQMAPIQVPQQRKVGIQDPAPPDMSQFKKTEMPEESSEFKAFESLSPQAEAINKVAVIQRITEKSGKSVFLAEVEVYAEDGNQILKTRTNGVGKWQASLPLGNYKVRISKRESVTKQKLEKVLNIIVDGRVSQLILDQVIIDK